MNHSIRMFVITPLLLLGLIAVPVATLASDGQLSSAMFNSPLAPDPVTPEPVETDVTPEPVETDVTPEPVETDVTPEPIETDVTPEPVETDVTPEPVETDVTPEPIETDVTPEPVETDVTPEPVETDVTPEPVETDVTPEPVETDVTPEPVETDVTPEPGETDVTPEPGETDVTPEPDGDDPIIISPDVPITVTVTITPIGGTVTTPEPPPTVIVTVTMTTTPTQPTSPISTPTPGTVVIPPTATPVPVVLPPAIPPTATPTRPMPTPMSVMPTPTPTPPASAMQLSGYWVEKVIGDRFSSVIYAYANDWLYRSSNDGSTWQLISSMPEVDDFVMSAFDPSILYSNASTSCSETVEPDNKPMYKSIDGGVLWEPLPDSENLRPLLTHAFDPNIVYATDCNWFYVSTDGGDSWIQKPDLSPDGLWNNYMAEVMTAVFLDANEPTVLISNAIYAGGLSEDGSGLVAFSNDGGDTWDRITPNISPSPFGLTALAADPFTIGRIWFTDPQGIWYSPDSGASWQFSANGLEDVTNVSSNSLGALNTLIIHPGEQLYLGTDRGLYTSRVESDMWYKISGTDFDQEEIQNIVFTESNSNLLYLNTDNGVYLVQIEE